MPPMVPPKIGPPGSSMAAIDGPPRPSMAAILGPPLPQMVSPQTTLKIVTMIMIMIKLLGQTEMN